MFKMEWNDKKVMAAVRATVDKVSKDIAEDVETDAIRKLIATVNKTTAGGLKDQFSVEKSNFKDGGYLVWCQGPKKWKAPYHASFVELGTYKDEAQPFLRPTVRKKKRTANKKFQAALDEL